MIMIVFFCNGLKISKAYLRVAAASAAALPAPRRTVLL